MTGLEATQVFSHVLNISFKFEKISLEYVTLTLRESLLLILPLPFEKHRIFCTKIALIFMEKESMRKIEVKIGLNQLLASLNHRIGLND